MKFIKCSFLEFTFRNMSNLQCLFHEITFLLQFKSQTGQTVSIEQKTSDEFRQFVVLVVAFVTVETSSIAFFALSSA